MVDGNGQEYSHAHRHLLARLRGKEEDKVPYGQQQQGRQHVVKHGKHWLSGDGDRQHDVVVGYAGAARVVVLATAQGGAVEGPLLMRHEKVETRRVTLGNKIHGMSIVCPGSELVNMIALDNFHIQ